MEHEKIAISVPVEISGLAKGLVFVTTCMLSFFVPFLLGHPQWLVGTVVNACLFLGALYLPKRYFVPLAVLPSLGVLSRGLIFGPFTYFLVYFLPFIWLGNLILMLVFRYTTNSKALEFVVSGFFRFFGAIICSSVAKFLVLLIIANIYFNFHFVPVLFLQAMGLNQLSTALAGGLISFLIFKLYGQFVRGSKRAS